MSMMVSFVLSFFPRDVLDEILNLIESVSEDFPSYSFKLFVRRHNRKYEYVLTLQNEIELCLAAESAQYTITPNNSKSTF